MLWLLEARATHTAALRSALASKHCASLLVIAGWHFLEGSLVEMKPYRSLLLAAAVLAVFSAIDVSEAGCTQPSPSNVRAELARPNEGVCYPGLRCSPLLQEGTTTATESCHSKVGVGGTHFGDGRCIEGSGCVFYY